MIASPAQPVRRGRRLEFRGVVQGVGFRPWLFRLASSLGVDGRVRNDAQGVTVEAFGTAEQLDELVARARREAPAAAVIDALEVHEIPPDSSSGFRIVPSPERGAATADREALRVSIPPDLATCAACLAEILDPQDRRFRYPFTNCTLCGPRFTIARDVPYDRPHTTMASFRMCPACEREYTTPSDRRFHAQPNACPECGPRLSLLDADGAPLSGDPLAVAAAALREGLVVAVKGLGGFHLACDATNAGAVSRLRARKRREEKPLAVMVVDLLAAASLAVLSDEERDLLGSVERPIVIVRGRPGGPLAAEVSKGSPTVGLMLAYTPLHHLVLREAGRPLVMTSGNLSDEPIVTEDADAVTRLHGIADRFLVHDRAIDARADDSVARVIAGRSVVLRRARGHVPRGIAVHRPFQQPVLAVGAHLKNTFAIGVGDGVVLGPHVGDLETLEAYGALEDMVARMERFLSVRPAVVACDRHPEYLSTRYARERAEALGARLVEVQHHHAHVAAAMAENALDGPVLGLAWDGTGLGDDGTAWGGELLLATYTGYERLATFRPVALAGGDRAMREPWRVALAMLDDAFDRSPPLDRLPVLAARTPAEIRVVRQMIAGGVNAPLAHGVGRVFDALGALVLGQGVARFEAQVAMALEWTADAAEHPPPYPFTLDLASRPWQVDLRPLVRAVIADLLAGQAGPLIAGRFHDTLGRIAGELVTEAVRRHGRLPVVLSGGCFQNARLVESCLARLAAAGVEVFTHHRVPPGDGGLALGQAVIAAAVVRERGVESCV